MIPKNTPLMGAALAYYDTGLNVFPLAPNTKGEPKIKWKPYQTKRPARATLKGWFADPRRNIAVIMGECSGGLVCRDFDKPDSYFRWKEEVGEIVANRLPTVKSGKGFHVYAKTTIGEIARFSKAYVDLGDGELRLQECYCVLPPSTHPSGAVYSLLHGTFDGDFFVDSLSEICFDRNFLNSPSLVTYEAHEAYEAQEAQEAYESHDSKESHEVQEFQAIECEVEKTPSPQLEFSDTTKRKIKAAIEATVPTEQGNRNKQIFKFGRKLKAIVGVVQVEPMRSIVLAWHNAAVQSGEHTFDDTWSEFVYAWAEIRFPEGKTMEAIVKKTIELGSHPVCAAMKYQSPELRFIASLCAQLSDFHKGNSFFLGSRILERVITEQFKKSSSPTMLWKHLNRLVSDKVLECVERGNRQRANVYKWIWTGQSVGSVDVPDWLAE